MNHLSDKDLDRLSREAAEQFDVDQNTSGWEQVQQKLERELPVSDGRERKRFLLLLLFLAFLTGGGLFYQYYKTPIQQTPKKEIVSNGNEQDLSGQKSNPDIQIPAASNKSGTNEQERKILPGTTLSVKELPGTEAKKMDRSVLKKITAENFDPKQFAQEPPSNKKISSSIQQPERIKNNNRGRSIAETEKTDGDKSVSGIVNDGSQKKNLYKSQISQLPAEGDAGKITNETAIKPLQQVATDSSATSVKPASVTEPAGTIKSANSQKKATAQSSGKRPLTFSVIAGIDQSSVKFTHYDNPGFNAGIGISWQFMKKLSVTTGVLYTKKNYAANGKDYHPPHGYWTNYITLDELQGSCWMLDLPLNIRYDIKQSKIHNLFASAGLSTYLMNKEFYTYYYVYNSNNVHRNWTNHKNSNYLFSVLNVSAGYEKKLNEKFSIQGEPYLKIPLKGVGFGKMQMNSVGINFSLRYTPSFNSKASPTAKANH